MNATKLIADFREVTTVNEAIQNVVAFSFDLSTGDSGSNNIATRDMVQLQWETANNSSGVIDNLSLTKSVSLPQDNCTTKGAVRYRFTVTAREVGDGPLRVTLSVKLQCLNYGTRSCNWYYRSWCTCTQWQYQGESDTIQISAKRGALQSL